MIPLVQFEKECVVCGARVAAGSDALLDWRVFPVDGAVFYSCPKHDPKPPGTMRQYQAANERITAAIRQFLNADWN